MKKFKGAYLCKKPIARLLIRSLLHCCRSSPEESLPEGSAAAQQRIDQTKSALAFPPSVCYMTKLGNIERYVNKGTTTITNSGEVTALGCVNGKRSISNAAHGFPTLAMRCHKVTEERRAGAGGNSIPCHLPCLSARPCQGLPGERKSRPPAPNSSRAALDVLLLCTTAEPC